MSSEGARQRWQFSLRSFLLAALLVGPSAGVVGPIIRDAITEWKPPPRRMPSRVLNRPAPPSPESEGYYETGETPLY
jgi:hypothetical protein